VKSKTTLKVVQPKIYAVVPAGGVGSRLGADRPKQYLPILGRQTMLERSASILLEQTWIDKVIVVVAAEDGYQEAVARILKACYGDRVEFLLEGGATRRDTVLSGLRYLLRQYLTKAEENSSKQGNPSSVDSLDAASSGGGLNLGQPNSSSAWVLVHDAARPGLDAPSLERLRATVLADRRKAGGILALPMSDTVKQVVGSGHAKVARSAQTLDRRLLWAAQTPQMFPLEKLVSALKRFQEVTDEASAMEQAGAAPLLVGGSTQNFKVTSADDLLLMRALLKARG
jgi:2-C-methyl-D-erythritol 4-phosphate cytidylyltransferase